MQANQTLFIRRDEVEQAWDLDRFHPGGLAGAARGAEALPRGSWGRSPRRPGSRATAGSGRSSRTGGRPERGKRMQQGVLEDHRADRPPQPHACHRAVPASPGRRPWRPARPARLPASNLAHAMAVCRGTDRERMRDGHSPHIAIVTSYNDLVSAHHTFERYPAILKKAVRRGRGCRPGRGAAFPRCATGHPGRAGMDLSLVSRDRDRDGHGDRAFPQTCATARCLLGYLRQDRARAPHGGLQFGHLPMILVPGGPMRSGLPNKEKARAREASRRGRIRPRGDARGRVPLLTRRRTCTF